PLPLEEVSTRLGWALGDDGPRLAASLPVLRDAVVRRSVLRSSVAAAGLVLAARGSSAMLPALSLLQTRMLRRLRVADGETPPQAPQEAALAVAPDLAAAVATGLACRTLARRLPVRGRLVGGAIAFAGTVGLGALARRLPSRG
ncbi:MAG: hypothetical protein ACRC50_04690, partial [Gaiella sp.]